MLYLTVLTFFKEGKSSQWRTAVMCPCLDANKFLTFLTGKFTQSDDANRSCQFWRKSRRKSMLFSSFQQAIAIFRRLMLPLNKQLVLLFFILELTGCNYYLICVGFLDGSDAIT